MFLETRHPSVDEADRAVDLVKKRQSICIFGMPGTGKTTLVKCIYNYLLTQDTYVVTTAFTGRAAMNLPGSPMTMSRLSGLRIGDKSFHPDMDENQKPIFELYPYQVGKNFYNRSSVVEAVDKASQQLTRPNLTIIVDEVSMTSAEFMYLFHRVVELKRSQAGCSMTDVSWILVGDFGQLLPPDNKANLLFEQPVFYIQEEKKKRVVKKPSFFDMVQTEVISLTKVHRQADPTYLQAISWAYWGKAVHPLFIQRAYETPPDHAISIYFNNQEVLKENTRYIQDFIARNPGCKQQTFKALSNFSDMDRKLFLKELHPVTEEYTIAVAFNPDGSLKETMPFMCTLNILDSSGDLLVANGESVEVVDIVGNRAIEVENKHGRRFQLGYTEHPMPARSDGVTPQFIFLPGYPGVSCSIYKAQGMTFEENEARIYGLWQYGWNQQPKATSLHGILTVASSRNKSIEDVYFSSPGGVDQTIDFLEQSLTINEKALRFLLNGKEPTWISKASSLIEFRKAEQCQGKWFLTFDHHKISEDEVISARYTLGYTFPKAKALVIKGEDGKLTNLKADRRLSSLARSMNRIAQIWYDQYLPEGIYQIDY